MTKVSPKVIALTVFELACRSDFSQPGYALVKQPQIKNSLQHRRAMLSLKESLSDLYLEKSGKKLGWYTMSRFDQKNTTKLHRDGGPPESLLILGYEPTAVKCELSISDYSACAYTQGLNPEEFLEKHNPMYQEGLDLLLEYTSILEEFDPTVFQILIINNSNCPFDKDSGNWQGVLHGAVVNGQDDRPRIINSTSVIPMSADETEAVPIERLQSFMNEDNIGAREY